MRRKQVISPVKISCFSKIIDILLLYLLIFL